MDYKNKEILKLKNTYTYSNKDYLILKKEEKKEDWQTGTSTDSFYLLYKDGQLYTGKTEKWTNRENINFEDPPDLQPELLNDQSEDVYINLFNELYEELLQENTPSTGGKRIASAASTYKSNGDKVLLLINKKKLHRSIYVKGNGKAKYCKINNEFVLLSKLKNKVIEL